jgi:hypothetical protein
VCSLISEGVARWTNHTSFYGGLGYTRGFPSLGIVSHFTFFLQRLGGLLENISGLQGTGCKQKGSCKSYAMVYPEWGIGGGIYHPCWPHYGTLLLPTLIDFLELGPLTEWSIGEVYITHAGPITVPLYSLPLLTS